jgi:hypothetical protein
MSDWEGTMGLIRGRRLFASGGLALIAALVLLTALATPGAGAAERVLDLRLSLMGGCVESDPVDPVEDPGCPGGTHPPSGQFAATKAVTTDFYGNIYVSNFGKNASGSQARIDIFDPNGFFISELKQVGAESLAVDSKGNLYVAAEIAAGVKPILRFEPSVYKPEEGKIEYGKPSVELPMPGSSKSAIFTGIAVNPANDRLFANFGSERLVEFDSAEAGNVQLSSSDLGTWPFGTGVAIDASRGRLYATSEDDHVILFKLNEVEGSPPGAEHKKVGTIIDASDVPSKDFGLYLSLAVDESTGNIYLLDGALNVLYQFDENGTYLSTIKGSFNVPFGAEIGIDNGPFSPNGALSSRGRYLYVPSGKTGTGHSFAFEETNFRAPEVISAATSGVTEGEAELQATLNPGNLETSFTFKYTTQENFEEEGFDGASFAGSGKVPAGNLNEEVAVAASGLQAGTQYRFQIVASNEKGSDEAEGSFSTYPVYEANSEACSNRALRIGPSAPLPDCRAFELVTPGDANGRAPIGSGHEGGWFTTRQVSPAGDKVPFRVEGGTLPGTGTGSYLGDPFVSSRGADGWHTEYIGPTGAEAVAVKAGGVSPDKGFSIWTAENKGSAMVEGKNTTYLRFPDGHSEILGAGSIGTDLEPLALMISEGGDHVVFGTGYSASSSTAVQLEPEAAPSGTQAIYDRTSDGVVHVVSLLPGDVPLGAGEDALVKGTSLDGKGVAFEAGTPKALYLRYADSETFEIGEGVQFAGVAEGGNRIFYLEGGHLWRFDAETEERTAFSSGSVVPVTISDDGSAAYFISTAKLTSEANPSGDFALIGQQNLYLSREGTISFVGTVTERDVVGTKGRVEQVDGLGLWVEAASFPSAGRFGKVPARTTADGGVLLFQARSPLTGYDPEGHSEVYRYDSAAERLHCLSCNPTGAAAGGDATLQSESRETFALFEPQVWIQNLRPDGRRAIFQSTEALVTGDTDGRQDIYEWEDDGVGSCTSSGGCTHLLSSGHSARNDYLFAVSLSGDDVFFVSSDLILPGDLDETPSIYDARVGGGFPEPVSVECQGEGCRPQLSPAPGLPDPQTPVQGSDDNVKPATGHCGKGKRKVKRGGKVRCVKKPKKKSRQKAGANQGGGRK